MALVSTLSKSAQLGPAQVRNVCDLGRPLGRRSLNAAELSRMRLPMRLSGDAAPDAARGRHLPLGAGLFAAGFRLLTGRKYRVASGAWWLAAQSTTTIFEKKVALSSLDGSRP